MFTDDEDKLEHFCLKYDEDDCRYRFVYNETIENGVVKYSVRTQKPQECPAKVFLLGIILGVIAAIVLIGLAMLLLWKLLTTIHDRREFARFEKERMMAKWDTVSLKIEIRIFINFTIFINFIHRVKIQFINKQHQRLKIQLMQENRFTNCLKMTTKKNLVKL
jgi:hypothetical protein